MLSMWHCDIKREPMFEPAATASFDLAYEAWTGTEFRFLSPILYHIGEEVNELNANIKEKYIHIVYINI